MAEQPSTDEQKPASPLIALPPDALARVCGYLETQGARRLAASAKISERALGSEAWAAVIKTNHGGLKLRPKDLDGDKAPAVVQKLHRRARQAKMASRLRSHNSGWGLPGFHGLATDGGVDEGDSNYWCDALFRPEPWLVFSSAVTARPVLCAAAYLVTAFDSDADIRDTDAADRAWMVERMEKAGLLFDDAGLDRLDSEPPDVVAQTFAEVTRVMDDQGWLHELVRDVHESRRAAVMERIRAKRDEIQDRPPARRPKPFAACKFSKGDGSNLLVNEHVQETLTCRGNDETGARNVPCAIATAIVICRPMAYSCPCSVGILFAVKRHPSVMDVALDSCASRTCRSSDDVANLLMAQTEETTRVELPESLGGGCGRVVQWDPAVVGGNSYRVLVDGRSVPTLCRREEATRLTGGDPFELPGFGVATLSYENAEGKVFDVASAWTGDVVPVAAFAFKDRGEDERRVTGETGQLRSLLKRSVAVRGLIVGLLQAEDRMREHRDAHPEPNLDMQFVGVEGYAYP